MRGAQCRVEQNDFHELSQIPEFPEMLLCTAAVAAAAAAAVLLNCVFSLMP